MTGDLGGIVLAMAMFLDLSTVASVGSAVALAVFAMVGVAAIRLRSSAGANLIVLLAGVATTLMVLLLFAIDTARNAPRTFIAMLAVGALAVVLDVSWKRRRYSAARHPRRRVPGRVDAAPGVVSGRRGRFLGAAAEPPQPRTALHDRAGDVVDHPARHRGPGEELRTEQHAERDREDRADGGDQILACCRHRRVASGRSVRASLGPAARSPAGCAPAPASSCGTVPHGTPPWSSPWHR